MVKTFELQTADDIRWAWNSDVLTFGCILVSNFQVFSSQSRDTHINHYCYRGPWTTVGVFTCSLKGSQNAKDPGTDC